MIQDGRYPPLEVEDVFAARLRQVIDSYGSTSAIARVIERSEGAVRKWLRGQSEPNVSDLRAICEITGTNVEWLVMGRGEQKRVAGVREPPGGGYGGEGSPLPPLHYKLMDEVMTAVKLEPRIGGVLVTPAKCSSILVTVYNMSRVARRVDTEGAERVVQMATGG